MREELERFNEWWFTGKVRKELAPSYRRKEFRRVVQSFAERQVLLITGLRRVGKTTLMYQAIDQLLKEVDPAKILYFSFDGGAADPLEVLRYYERNVLRKPFEEVDRVYVFFDEVQYVEGWPTAVKQFYDLYPNLKFFLSGSSSLLLSIDALEKLAGRFFTLKLKPLSFTEFLEMKGVKPADPELFPRRMAYYFNDYLVKAGFPEIVGWDDETRIAEYVKNSVAERIIFRDIPAVFGVRNLSLMTNLFKHIVSNPGAVVNLNTLSKTWQETRITISNYLQYLETSLVVKSLGNYRPSQMASSRKLRKYYPATTSLTFAYSRKDFLERSGGVLETYVVSALDAAYYFRDGRHEVDVVLTDDGLVLVEVKESVGAGDVAKLSRLAGLLKASKAVIVSRDERFSRENVEVIPVYGLEWSGLSR
ncbi:MAG: ATP-binding protein [Candidatus Caldarchaeum sp.]|nr:ATP-binding protein [Candidatus Caldarchaeum sp.]MCX8201279.1 ATP-binding protein [Candidatus Caldarchaeum sp.]MDW8435151.1 ATP-binding protein [Candidatus Caldarchaeum sp.]